MTPDPSPELADRVRAALSGRSVREIRMFGHLAFMVDDAMAVGVSGDRSLLVRVDPDRDAELLSQPHTTRPEMGAGRSMGVGWIRVAETGIADDASLNAWVAESLGYLTRRAGTR